MNKLNNQLVFLKQSCCETEKIKDENIALCSKVDKRTNLKAEFQKEIVSLKENIKDKSAELAAIRSGKTFQTKSRSIRCRKQKLEERATNTKNVKCVHTVLMTQN